jgi:hypothetical protein
MYESSYRHVKGISSSTSRIKCQRLANYYYIYIYTLAALETCDFVWKIRNCSSTIVIIIIITDYT